MEHTRRGVTASEPAEPLESARHRSDDVTLLVAACDVLLGAAARLVGDSARVAGATAALPAVADGGDSDALGLAAHALELMHARETDATRTSHELVEGLVVGAHGDRVVATRRAVSAAGAVCATHDVIDGLTQQPPPDWRVRYHTIFLATVLGVTL